MNGKLTESLTPQRRAENLRNSNELGGKDILHLGKSNMALALRLVAVTRLLNPKLAAGILKGAGFEVEIYGLGDTPVEKED